MQIILFDIDGTLINTGGAGQGAMDTVSAATGTKRGNPSNLKYAGRTDKSIIRDHLREFGIEETPESIAAYRDDFLRELPGQLHANEGRVLPAVLKTLERLRSLPMELGLITGNMRSAARMKLEHYGLSDYFYSRPAAGNGKPGPEPSRNEAMGGFGDDHLERDDMAREAMADIQNRLGDQLSGEHVWVIGDTPNDVQCARAIGAKVMAVATGSFSLDELRQTQPDVLCEDLKRADAWWAMLDV